MTTIIHLDQSKTNEMLTFIELVTILKQNAYNHVKLSLQYFSFKLLSILSEEWVYKSHVLA